MQSKGQGKPLPSGIATYLEHRQCQLRLANRIEGVPQRLQDLQHGGGLVLLRCATHHQLDCGRRARSSNGDASTGKDCEATVVVHERRCQKALCSQSDSLCPTCAQAVIQIPASLTEVGVHGDQLGPVVWIDLVDDERREAPEIRLRARERGGCRIAKSLSAVPSPTRHAPQQHAHSSTAAPQEDAALCSRLASDSRKTLRMLSS